MVYPTEKNLFPVVLGLSEFFCPDIFPIGKLNCSVGVGTDRKFSVFSSYMKSAMLSPAHIDLWGRRIFSRTCNGMCFIKQKTQSLDKVIRRLPHTSTQHRIQKENAPQGRESSQPSRLASRAPKGL